MPIWSDYRFKINDLDMVGVFIIIQARMTSTRLPGKVLMPLCRSSVLEVMLERLAAFKQSIVLATTDDASSLAIVDLCKKIGLCCYQGKTEDVLDRCYKALTSHGASSTDIIVRCTSDCPLVDPELVAAVIHAKRHSGYDYVGAGPHTGFPWGIDAAAFCFSALEDAHQNATEKFDREHVTPFIRRHYHTLGLHSEIDNSKYRLTLDEISDYEAIKAVYDRLDNRTDFSYSELISVLERYPELSEINKDVRQKNVNALDK